MIERRQMIIQENEGPAHIHQYQQLVFDIAGIRRLLWPGNSPDVNAIGIAPSALWKQRVLCTLLTLRHQNMCN